MVENEFYNDSFRALSAEKLGPSVLLLCAEKEESVQSYDEYLGNNSTEKEKE